MYCHGTDGCGDKITEANMVTAYFRKDQTIVPKSICKNCARRQTALRKRLDVENPHPPAGTSCQICCRVSKLNLDHCHATGKFRGYLCRECNLACGLLGDNSKNIRAALEYMERFEFENSDNNNKCQSSNLSTSLSEPVPDQ